VGFDLCDHTTYPIPGEPADHAVCDELGAILAHVGIHKHFPLAVCPNLLHVLRETRKEADDCRVDTRAKMLRENHRRDVYHLHNGYFNLLSGIDGAHLIHKLRY